MTVQTLEQLLEDNRYLALPQMGEAIAGTVISASRREVFLDIQGIKIGVIRGRELYTESSEYTSLKPGDQVEATVVELENENGLMELSFRFAGQRKAWEEILRLQRSGEAISVPVLDANKGGLIVRVGSLNGFLPVSQLAPEHYPRVTGGDKLKILEKLKSYVGQEMEVRVLDVNEADEKLIVSEKIIWEERQRGVIAQHHVGDVIEGEVTALADFGAFIKFDDLEGLAHISELAWQRIDHPRDVVRIGEQVRAEIIGVEGSKIFLSLKKLVPDPWVKVGERYRVGDIVPAKILKINPFGFFVELDPEIHGLVHVSEISETPNDDLTKIANVGETLSFRVVSIEPSEHRLGLSLKALKSWQPPEAESPKPISEETETTEIKKEIEETTESPVEKQTEPEVI